MDKKLNILLLEDCVEDADLIDMELRKTGLLFSLKITATEEQFLKALKNTVPDLVLADYSLPSFDGMSALLSFRKNFSKEVPFIFVTGTIGEEKAIETMRNGATDYVFKENLSKLGPVINRAILEKNELQKRKIAEKSLMNATHQWKTTFDAIDDAICLLSAEGEILRSNKAMAIFLKKPFDKIIGSTCWELVHKTEGPILECPVLRMRKTLQRETMILDVQEKTFQVTVDPILDKNGNLFQIVHIISDITERKRMEDDLRATNSRHSSMIANIGDVIGIMGADGIMKYKSPNIERWFGWKPEELVGTDGWETVHPEDIERIQKEFSALFEKDNISTVVEYRYKCKDDTYKWIELTAVNCINDTSINGILFNYHDISERKQAEEDLLKEKTLLKTIIDNIPVMLTRYNPDANMLYLNKEFEKKVGWTTEDIQDIDIMEKVCPDPDYRQQTVDFMLKANLEWREFTVMSKSGESIDSEWSNFRMEDGTQIGIGIDITEHKKDKRSLTKQIDLFELVINSVPARIFWKDLDLVYLGCNIHFTKDSGMKKLEDVIGKDDYSLVWKKDADVFRADDKLVINTGKSKLNYEEGFLNSEGEQVWWMTSKMPLRSSDGKIIGIIAISENITEQKKAEESLRISHERFITVLDSIDATIYVADMQTYEILFMNKFMKDIFGRDMTGEVCWNVFREESSPCRHCTNSDLVDKNGIPSGVKVWHDKNPVTGRHYINHDRAIEWIDGRLVRLQIATDITDYKRLEKELRQAQKMESIGTLAGGIAHDFNNILSSVIGYTELALSGAEKGTELEDDLQEVRIAGLRAKDLVKQILTFARQSDDAITPIQVNIIAKEVLRFIKSSIPSTIQISNNLISDSLIMGSPTQIHQVLMNLCTNAAYAMEKNGGILDLSVNDVTIDKMAMLDLKPGDYIEIKVTDTGMGISPQHIQTIFDPYFTTKPVGEGTGMGLAVVHGIVESYGGKITVDSTIGKGTCFTIYLPITKKRKVHTHSEKEDLPLGNENILFVDDETPIAKMGSKVLKQLGYSVTTRTNSIEALELFRSKPQSFDLVITDMTMPNMTGDKLAAEMMKIRSDISVVLCTGYSKKISEESAADIGIKTLVYKPVVKADLAKTVRKVLDKI